MPEGRKAHARHSTNINLDTLQPQNVKPQAVLTDLGLQKTNGLRVVARLTRDLPHNEVVGMGLVTSQVEILEFVQGGSAGKRNPSSLLTESLFTQAVDHPHRKGEENCPMEC
jgi:DNA-binding NarL/FixJ family response regulator